MGIEFWSGALLIVLITGAYTILGGLRAVIYTDALQAIVLILGSLTITIIGLFKIGGWNNLVESVGSSHFNMFLPADHPDFPWIGMVFAPSPNYRNMVLVHRSIYCSKSFICSK